MERQLPEHYKQFGRFTEPPEGSGFGSQIKETPREFRLQPMLPPLLFIIPFMALITGVIVWVIHYGPEPIEGWWTRWSITAVALFGGVASVAVVMWLRKYVRRKGDLLVLDIVEGTIRLPRAAASLSVEQVQAVLALEGWYQKHGGYRRRSELCLLVSNDRGQVVPQHVGNPGPLVARKVAKRFEALLNVPAYDIRWGNNKQERQNFDHL